MAASLAFTSLEAAKAYTHDTGDACDALYPAWIEAASSWIEAHLGRLAKIVSRTQVLSVPRGRCVFALEAAPIVSVTSVKSAADWNFDAVSALDPFYYDVDAERGIVRVRPGVLYVGPRSLQIVYEGGLAADTAALETAHPTLALACQQIVYGLFQRRHKLQGETEAYVGHTVTVKDLNVPAMTRTLLMPYRRGEAIA